MKKLLTVLSTICLCSSVNASEMTFKFGSPSFSGNGKSSHYLTIENIEKTRKDAIKAQQKADAEKLGLDAQKFYDISSTASGQNWSMTSYCPAPGPVESAPSNKNYEKTTSCILIHFNSSESNFQSKKIRYKNDCIL